MQLFLIRHPRPLIGLDRCYGQLDVAAEDPKPIAERLHPLLGGETPVLSSPLRRARVLAEALHPQPRFDDRLMEMSFGDWEGMLWSDIDRSLFSAWAANPLHFVPPGGESVAALQARVVECLFCQNDERLAIVAHAGVIRLIAGHCQQLSFREWCQLPLDFGSLSRLEIDTGERSATAGQPSGRVLYLNR